MPTATNAAPAARYCRASAAVRIPPTPITGIPTRSVTRRVASTPMGRSAGPLSPPLPLPSRASSIPGTVFTSVTASAPSCCATRAMAARSGSTGESFTLSGRVEARRQAATRLARLRGSAPNSRPPALVLGHDALISNAAIASSEVRRSITRT